MNGYHSLPTADETGVLLDQRFSDSQFYNRQDMQTEWTCGMGYEVRQLKDIDCVSQRFFCDFSIFIKWYDPKQGGPNKGETLDPGKVEIPQVMIANSVDVQTREVTVARLSTDPPGVLHCETVYTGLLTEFMELELFPVDCQDLTIAVRFKDTRWRTRLLNEPRFNSIGGTVELAEWLIFRPSVKLGRGPVFGRPTWELKLKVSRKSGFYMSNVIMMVGGITTLTFCILLFDPMMWEQRSALCSSLLLTSVAFKFVIAGSMPKVSFMTILDVYMMVCTLVMVALILESAGVKLILVFGSWSRETILRWDLCSGSTIFGSWFFFNLFYFCRFYQIQGKQRASLGDKLPNISTNQESKGAMWTLLTADVDNDDEAETDEAEELLPVDV